MNRLSTKFFITVGLFTGLFSLFLLHRTYVISTRNVREITGQQAELALAFERSIRKYVDEKIRPVMYEYVNEDAFIPETMSTSFVARAIFEDVQKAFPDFILKFSSDNPRNPSNQAGPEELELIRYFNENPDQDHWRGEMKFGGEPYFAAFMARRMKESCLRCHGDPAAAPESLKARYGSSAGFHRPVGQVVALDTVAIPISRMSRQLWDEIERNSGVLIAGILLLTGLLFVATKVLLTDRLTRITRHFAEAARQTDSSVVEPVQEKATDEIGVMARSFNALAERLREYYFSLSEQVEEKTRAYEQLKRESEDRQKAEKALIQAEARYRGIFENAVYGILQSAMDGKLISANPATARIFGYPSAEEMMTRSPNVLEALFPNDEDRRRLVAALGDGPVRDRMVSLRDGDAERRWLSLNLWKSQDPVHGGDILEAMVEDITEQKKSGENQRQLEAQLRQAQKMESIGRLAGGVAHDFNNLLSSIIGYSELALMKLPRDAESVADIETVRAAGEKAEELTRQLLAFSRKQVLEPRPVDLDQVVRGMTKILSMTLGEHVRLELRGQGDPCIVQADTGQVEQMLMNLAVNSRDAMPDGGCFLVETSRVTVEEEYAAHNPEISVGEYALISVSDTGVGMSPEVRDKIFEPFFTTKEKGKGTGLGLATVYGIVKQHGGHIQVYSETGSGTTFRIYLPLMGGHMPAVQKKDDPATTYGGSETILVVDDDRSIRNLVVDTLESFGYTLIGASGGDEALKLMAAWNGPVHLVLTDVIMPGMNGKELAERIARKFPSIPILYMSGYSGDVIAHQGLLEPGVEYLQKPLTPSRLLNKVREVLDSRT